MCKLLMILTGFMFCTGVLAGPWQPAPPANINGEVLQTCAQDISEVNKILTNEQQTDAPPRNMPCMLSSQNKISASKLTLVYNSMYREYMCSSNAEMGRQLRWAPGDWNRMMCGPFD